MADLTLDSLLQKKGAAAEEAAEPASAPAENQLAEAAEALTPEQIAKADEIRRSIDLTDSNVLMQYGVGAQRDIQTFSEGILEKVKVKDSGKTGELLADLSDQVRSMHVEELTGGKKIPILGSLAGSLRKSAGMKAWRYRSTAFPRNWKKNGWK